MNDSAETKNHQDIWVTDFDTNSAINFKRDLFAAYEDNPAKPIIVHINTDGGSTDGLFSMLDTIDAIRSLAPTKPKIITAACGRAMSAGAVLLSHGDIRLATKNATIMMHQVCAGYYGAKGDIDVEYKEIERINDRILTILAENCNLTGGLEEAKSIFSRNVYFTAEQAQKIGLIDGIGYPKINELKVYELVVCGGLEKNSLKKQLNKKRGQKNDKSKAAATRDSKKAC